MSPEAQRIKIAEACGWTGIRMSNRWQYSDDPANPQDLSGLSPAPHHYSHIPNYPADLNACAEMRKVLTPDQRRDYAAWVEAVVENAQWEAAGKPAKGLDRQLCENTGDPHGTCNYGHLAALLDATAPQHCEAFLRTIGQWQATGGEKK
jgi:hypothetical protein